MYRAIDVKMWSDPKIRSLSPKDKLLFIYLVTNSYTHLSGIYHLPFPVIMYETGLTEKEVGYGIDTLSIPYLIRYDMVSDTVWVVKMMRYSTKSPKIIASVASHLRTLHNSPLIKDFLDEYDTLSIPYRYPIDTVSPQYQYQEQEQRQYQEQEQRQNPQTPTAKKSKPKLNQDRFNIFWKVYPKKAAKPNAEKAFEKIDPDKSLLDAMLSAIAWQSQTEDWVKESGKFIPHPATWLNGRRWEDQPPSIPRMSALTAKNLAHGKEFVNGNYGKGGIL